MIPHQTRGLHVRLSITRAGFCTVVVKAFCSLTFRCARSGSILLTVLEHLQSPDAFAGWQRQHASPHRLFFSALDVSVVHRRQRDYFGSMSQLRLRLTTTTSSPRDSPTKMHSLEQAMTGCDASTNYCTEQFTCDFAKAGIQNPDAIIMPSTNLAWRYFI